MFDRHSGSGMLRLSVVRSSAQLRRTVPTILASVNTIRRPHLSNGTVLNSGPLLRSNARAIKPRVPHFSPHRLSFLCYLEFGVFIKAGNAVWGGRRRRVHSNGMRRYRTLRVSVDLRRMVLRLRLLILQPFESYIRTLPTEYRIYRAQCRAGRVR